VKLNMNGLIFFPFLLVISCTGLAQSQYVMAVDRKVPKSNNLIELQKDRHYHPAGRCHDLLVYQFNRKGLTSSGFSGESSFKIYYSELSQIIKDSIDLRKPGRKSTAIMQVDSLTLYHGFFEVPKLAEDKFIDELDRGVLFLNYQDVWLESKTLEVRIQSFPTHYYDKDISYTIDPSGKYVVVGEYVSSYLRSSKADSIITIIQLDDKNVQRVTKREIYCMECINPQVVGDYIYFGQKFNYLRGADVYDWRFYKAPIFDLSKRELIAEYIEPLLMSPDGRFMFGRKSLHGKQTFLILDVKAKKFQYLLGRQYAPNKYFYSPAFNQFGFDRAKDIIYVEYPKVFPFNSIGSHLQPTRPSRVEDSVFWQKFKDID
jgi:hypothetical protein